MAILATLRSLGRNLQRELKVLRLVLADRRTPLPAKLLLWLAVAYLVLPFDLIPDWIPGLGQLDDLIIVPALVVLAYKMIPKHVLEDCRARAEKP